MKKYLLLLLVLFVATPASASLYSYYQEQGLALPSISERRSVALDNGFGEYSGTRLQNITLEDILRGRTVSIQPTLGATPNESTSTNQGYNPVTGYQSRTTQYVSASATTIPVVSTKDLSQKQIVLANISSAAVVKVYLNFEPGTSKEEPFMCTGITATSWTGCTRGLPFQSGSEVTSSTVATAHNAGAAVIITNIGQFYNQYVSIDGNQTINNVKNFTRFPTFNTSTQIPTSSGQFATKYYVDSVGAGGFTSLNVSTTLGLLTTGSIPEKVGINASSTTGVAFSVDGSLYQKVSSTTGLASDVNGIYIVTSTLTNLIAGQTFINLIATSTPTANSIPISSASGTLDAWVSATTSFNFVPNTITNGLTTTYWSSMLNVYPRDTTGVADGRGLMGFTVTNGTLNNANVRYADYIDVAPGATTGYGALIQGASSTNASFVSTTEMRIRFRAKTSYNSGGGNERGIGLTTASNGAYQGVTSVTSSARFVFSDSVTAVTANGASNSNTPLADINYTSWNTYEILFTTSSVKYYVNGVLRVTNTTTVPTTSPKNILFNVGSAPDSNIISLSDVVITQKVNQ